MYISYIIREVQSIRVILSKFITIHNVGSIKRTSSWWFDLCLGHTLRPKAAISNHNHPQKLFVVVVVVLQRTHVSVSGFQSFWRPPGVGAGPNMRELLGAVLCSSFYCSFGRSKSSVSGFSRTWYKNDAVSLPHLQPIFNLFVLESVLSCFFSGGRGLPALPG